MITMAAIGQSARFRDAITGNAWKGAARWHRTVLKWAVVAAVLLVPAAGAEAAGKRPPDPAGRWAHLDPVLVWVGPNAQGRVEFRRRRDDMPVILVPAGAFVMGSDRHQEDERPARTVTLDAFLIDKYEVSNARYDRFARWMTSAGDRQRDRVLSAEGAGRPSLSAERYREIAQPELALPELPATRLDWYQAAAYARWAWQVPPGTGPVLPTEAQWERAARGTDRRRYPWGDAAPTDDRARFHRGPQTIPRAAGNGAAGASPAGVWNMAGNVWEWCWDKYHERAYRYLPATDPVLDQPLGEKVVRGGCYALDAYHLRCANRCRYPGYMKRRYVGFRCAIRLADLERMRAAAR